MKSAIGKNRKEESMEEEIKTEVENEEETSEEVIEEEEKEEEKEVLPQTEKKKQTAQERINEITKKYRDAERDVEYWKNLADARFDEALSDDPPASPPKESGDRPKQNTFESIEDYEDALLNWYTQKRDTERTQKRSQREIQESVQQFNKKAAKIKEEYPDFDQVVETPVFTDAMRKTLFTIEHGPMVAYHIAKNKEIAQEIVKYPPERQMYEISKIETQLLLAQKTKKVSEAPSPLKPVGDNSQGETDPSKMSMTEYMVWEEQKEKARIAKKLGIGE